MTQEEKQLLLKDLSARLPYGVMVHLVYDDDASFEREMGIGSLHDIMFDNVVDAKPYLRPMSSMTEEEIHTFRNMLGPVTSRDWGSLLTYVLWSNFTDVLDWLNSHHFDYRGLIEKGLALEAPKWMYNG